MLFMLPKIVYSIILWTDIGNGANIVAQVALLKGTALDDLFIKVNTKTRLIGNDDVTVLVMYLLGADLLSERTVGQHYLVDTEIRDSTGQLQDCGI